MSIDYGEKRIGIAITDPLKLWATPYKTIQNLGWKHVSAEIIEVVKSQQIDRIIIGLPLHVSGDDSEKTLQVREFSQKVQNVTELPIVLFDERYTTCDANDILRQKGLNWQQSKQIVDPIAAAVVLTSYINDNKD
jgi:putative Holliday junction resolvase